MYSTPFRVAWDTCKLFNTPRSRCPLCAATVSSTAGKSYYSKAHIKPMPLISAMQPSCTGTSKLSHVQSGGHYSISLKQPKVLA